MNIRPEDVILLILLLLPLVAVGYVAPAKFDSEAERVKRMQTWIRTKHEALSSECAYNTYVLRSYLWVLELIDSQTNRIPSPHWGTAAWLFSTGYVALLLLLEVSVTGWTTAVIALSIGAVLLIFAILRESNDDDYEPRRGKLFSMPLEGGKVSRTRGFLRRQVHRTRGC